MAIACPSCGSGVSETAEKCPICMNPMREQEEVAPPPGPAAVPVGVPGLPNLSDPLQPSMPTGGGEVRVSLTGEVYEVPRQPPPPTGPGAPPSPPGKGKAPAPPQRPGPTRGKYGIPVEEEPEKKSPAGVIFGTLLAMIVIGGAGYWFMNNRSNPKENALIVYKAFSKLDFKSMYPLVAFNDKDKAKYPDADKFDAENQAKLNGSDPMAAMAKQALSSLSDISVGEPVINGDKADVPSSSTMTMNGQTLKFKGTVHMIKQGGIWKLDATGSEAQSEQMGRDLIGQPDLGGGGGGPAPTSSK